MLRFGDLSDDRRLRELPGRTRGIPRTGTRALSKSTSVSHCRARSQRGQLQFEVPLLGQTGGASRCPSEVTPTPVDVTDRVQQADDA